MELQRSLAAAENLMADAQREEEQRLVAGRAREEAIGEKARLKRAKVSNHGESCSVR